MKGESWSAPSLALSVQIKAPFQIPASFPRAPVNFGGLTSPEFL